MTDAAMVADPATHDGSADQILLEESRQRTISGLFRLVSTVRRQMTATGMIDRDGECTLKLETYAGSSAAVRHHLDPACPRIRARSRTSFEWRTPGVARPRAYLDEVDVFRISGSRKVCPDCAAARPAAASLLALTLLHRALIEAAEFTQDLEAHVQGFPRLASMRSHADAAHRLSGGADRIGAAGLAGVQAAMSDLLDAADAALATEEDLLEASAADRLPDDVLRSLAAAAAAGADGPYRLNPNPQGRTLEALSDASPGTERRMPYFASGVFDRWYSEQSASDKVVRWGAADAEREVAREDPSPYQVCAVSRWVVEPDVTLGPWELTLSNWRALAVEEFTLLFGDWADRYEHVMSAPDEACWLLLHDSRAEKLVGLARTDRYGALEAVVTRYPARPLSSGMFALRVPVAVARALDGLAVEAGVQAASLEGVPSRKVEAVAETALRLADDADTRAWLAPSVALAVAVER